MQTQRHIIKRQVLEVAIQQQAQAQPLYAEMARIYRQRIVPLIDQACTALSTPDRLHQIDMLTLNIGTLNPNSLEEDFVRRVRQQLHTALADKINDAEQRPITPSRHHAITPSRHHAITHSPSTKSASQLDLFLCFVHTGTIPWWADATDPHLLTENLTYLLAEEGEALRHLMSILARDRDALKRIVSQYAAEQLDALVRHLVPALKPAKEHSPQTWVALLSDAAIQQLGTSGQSGTSGRVETEFLSKNSVSRRTSGQVSGQTVGQASGHRDEQSGQVETKFLPRNSGSGQVSGQSYGYNSHLRSQQNPLSQQTFSPQSLWQHVLHVASLTGRHHTTPASFYEAVLTRIAHERSMAIESLIIDLHHYLQMSNAPHTTPLMTLLKTIYRNTGMPPVTNPTNMPPVTSTLDVAPIQNSLGIPPVNRNTDISNTNNLPVNSPDRPFAKRHTDIPPIHSSPNHPFDKRSPVTPIRQPQPEIDELYIANAGLVILWPYLTPFFERLGLLHDKQFVDDAAQQRAVGCLQMLATGETTFPEYHLPFNKLLCGLDWQCVYAQDSPLNDTELAEGEMLLQAIIEQVPILNNMSVAGFRQTFLLREGVLTTRDGAWLLRVARETYDVVLDRFPWSWGWVKLSWMERPLQVEW